MIETAISDALNVRVAARSKPKRHFSISPSMTRSPRDVSRGRGRRSPFPSESLEFAPPGSGRGPHLLREDPDVRHNKTSMRRTPPPCQHWILALTLVTTATPAFAAISARSFFRRPDALFASGQAHPGELERRKLREFQEINYQIQKDKISLKIPTTLALRDMDLSLKLAHVKTGVIAQVIGTRGPWAYVAANGKKTWWPLNEGLPIPDDRGLAIPLTRVQMRAEPEWKTEIVRPVEALTRLRLIDFRGDWVLVSPVTEPEVKGWIDVNSVILKADFASFVLPIEGRWTPVRYRQGADLVTSAGDRIPIERVQSMMTRPDLGILTEDLAAQGLYQRSFVTIKSWESLKWVVSRLPGHGEVFWKDEENGPGFTPRTNEKSFSFEEILKKPIFSVAFHPNNPRQGIIAAEGVYMTTDGLNWSKIDYFGDDNLPVAISAEHEIFVGQYRSTDGGKSFLPYLKWEQIAAMIGGKHQKDSRILRLVKINPLDSKKVEIEIDTGLKTAKLIGSTKFGLVTSWKTKTPLSK